MEYMETWLRLQCPDCGAINWLCVREDDDTIPDEDALRCHNCKKCQWLGLAAVDPTYRDCLGLKDEDIEDIAVDGYVSPIYPYDQEDKK